MDKGLLRAIDISSVALPDDIETIELKDLDIFINDNVPARINGDSSTLGVSLDVDQILESIAGFTVPVAVTPLGNADSPVGDRFAQPLIEEMTVSDLLHRLEHQNPGEICYMQSQDDNLRKELSGTFGVPQDLPIVRSVSNILQNPPDASNLWIGLGNTTSRLHNDNYDNIYTQLAGHKRIYLIPPTHVYGLDEKFLKPATYHRQGSDLVLLDGPEPTHKVLFPTVDPSEPSTFNNIYRRCKTYVVDLKPGDVLFIPALWYHQVEILGNELNISANYWYAASTRSPLWSNWDFLRYSALTVRGYYDADYFAEDEDDD